MRILTGTLIGLCGLSTASAFDAFLLLEGIPGESVDSRHQNWIDVNVFQQGLANVTDQLRFSDMSFTKAQDKSSPLLFLRTANGEPIPKATLELTQAGDNRIRFYRVILSNCVVRASSVAGSAGGDKPTEALALSYNWISWTYTEFDAAGRSRGDMTAFWDLLRNSGQGPFRLTGTRQGANIVVSWDGIGAITYKLFGSPTIAGPYSLVQYVTPTTNGPIRLTFPIRNGNLFYHAETGP